MNIPYLVTILKTDKLSEVISNIDLVPLDMNLAVWDSIDRGEIEIDEEIDFIKVLGVAVQPSSDDDLRLKLIRVVQHYAKNETNITRGRLNTQVKDSTSGNGYRWHEYIMALQHLVDRGHVTEEVVEIPEVVEVKVSNRGKRKQVVTRPEHKFVFLGLPGNDNKDWNLRAVNKWLAETDGIKVK